jgi:hypothetical protein
MTLAAGGAALGYLGYRSVLPKGPGAGYFVPNNRAIVEEREIKVKFATFRPVFLWQYTRDGGHYFKAVYRDGADRPRLVDLFVYGRTGGEDLDPALLIEGDKEIVGAADKKPVYRLRIGRRIEAEYILEAEPWSEIRELGKVCYKSANTRAWCQRVTLAGKAGYDYVMDFKVSQVMGKGKSLPVLSIKM